MLYQFLDANTHRPRPGLGDGTFVAANGHAVAIHGIGTTHSDAAFEGAGHSWPLYWKLRVTVPKLSERIDAIFANQLVRNSIVPTFWEGVANAKGTHRGPCFVEISYR